MSNIAQKRPESGTYVESMILPVYKPWSSLYRIHYYPARIDVRKELFLRNTFSISPQLPPPLRNPQPNIPTRSTPYTVELLIHPPKIHSNNTTPTYKSPTSNNPATKTQQKKHQALPYLPSSLTTPHQNQINQPKAEHRSLLQNL